MVRRDTVRHLSEAGRDRMARVVAGVLSLLVTGAALYLLSRFVDMSKVPDRLAEADPLTFASMVVLAFSVLIFGLTHKWRMVMARVVPGVGYWELVLLNLGGSPLVPMMPFKSYHVVPAVYFKKTRGIPMSLTLGTILFDKATTVLGLTIAAVFGTWLSNAVPGWLALAALAAAGASLVPGLPGRMIEFLGIYKTRLSESAAMLVRLFDEVPLHIRLLLVLYGFVLQLCLGSVLVLSMRALGLDVPLLPGAVLGATVILVANLPITVAGMGTREGMILLLFGKYGDPETLVAASFLFLAVDAVIPILIGTLFLPALMHRLMRKDLKKEEQE